MGFDDVTVLDADDGAGDPGSDGMAAGGREGPRPLSVVAAVLVVAVVAIVLVVARSGDDAGVRTEDATLSSGATFQSGSARVRLTGGDGSPPLEGRMTFAAAARGSFTVDDNGSLTEIRAFPDASFLQVGLEWIRLSNDELADGTGFRLRTGGNPFLDLVSFLVSSLDHAIPESIQEVGTDTSRGEPITLFTARLDLPAALAANADIVDQTTFQNQFAGVGEQLTVGLDGQGRARVVTIQGGDPDKDLGIELWDFGVAVDVEVPAGAVSRESDTLLTAADDADDALRLGDLAPSDDAACEVLRTTTAVASLLAPSDVAQDWSEAAARLRRVATVDPSTTDVEEFFLLGVADIYDLVAAELRGGKTMDDLDRSGLAYEGRIAELETLAALELTVARSVAETCNSVGG